MNTVAQVSEKSLANLKPWQPGQSGNPGGGPKTRNLLKALRAAIEKEYDGVTGAEMIAGKLMELVADGNVHAIREVYDRTEGKPLQANLNLNIDESVSRLGDDEWESFKLREDQRRQAIARVQLDALPGSEAMEITLRSAPTTNDQR